MLNGKLKILCFFTFFIIFATILLYSSEKSSIEKKWGIEIESEDSIMYYNSYLLNINGDDYECAYLLIDEKNVENFIKSYSDGSLFHKDILNTSDPQILSYMESKNPKHNFCFNELDVSKTTFSDYKNILKIKVKNFSGFGLFDLEKNCLWLYE